MPEWKDVMHEAAGTYSKGLGKSRTKEFTNDVEVMQYVVRVDDKALDRLVSFRVRGENQDICICTLDCPVLFRVRLENQDICVCTLDRLVSFRVRVKDHDK